MTEQKVFFVPEFIPFPSYAIEHAVPITVHTFPDDNEEQAIANTVKWLDLPVILYPDGFGGSKGTMTISYPEFLEMQKQITQIASDRGWDNV